MPISRALARPAALTLAAALVLPLAACADESVTTPGADVTTTTSAATDAPLTPARFAAEAGTDSLAWLASLERVDGLLATDGEPDLDLTIETMLAALAGGDAALASSLGSAFTPAVVDDLLGDGTTSADAGATAKAGVVLGWAGMTYTAKSLVTRLVGLLDDEGRLVDLGGTAGTSVVDQAWGVLALTGAGVSDAATSAATFLAAQQCVDGSFPSVVDAESCGGDVAATAFAVSALATYGRLGDGGVDAEVAADALHWLGAAAVAAPGGTAWETGSPLEADVRASALALTALDAVGGDTAVRDSARNWLAEQAREVDGARAVSVDGTTLDPHASAIAVPALLGTPLSEILVSSR